MATLDVTEYVSLAADDTGNVIAAGREPSRTNQQVAIAAASAQSAAFDSATRFIRVHTDAACRIAIGSNPVASAASMRLPAGGTEYLGVTPGHKIAVIATT